MKIIAIADTHCGHVAGLTPPDWWSRKYKKLHSSYWNWFIDNMPCNVDMLMCLGDMIEGTGSRSGGTELLTTDRDEQCDMATAIIKIIRPKKVVMVTGTSYHTGEAEQWEHIIADRVNAKIGIHEWVKCSKTIFDLKHHIGGSQIPHGRYTSIARDALWNFLWAERNLQPKSNIILRAHVHYFAKVECADYMAMTLPALQGAHTRYGASRCSGTVDFGFVEFNIQDGVVSCEQHLAVLEKLKPKMISV